MFGNMFGDASAQVGELIERLKTDVNLTDEQAKQVMQTIRGFIIEKYPMLEGMVGNMFGEQ